jgi:hypothetical protein
MIRRIDVDGLSRLEEIEADPTAVAAPRAKRLSESGAQEALSQQSPDSAMHELLDAHFDPDRRTEVGAPPTGQVPKSDPTSRAPKSVTTAVTDRPSRAGLWIVLALVILGAGGFTVWKLTQKPADTSVVTPSTKRDGGIQGPSGTLEIDPNPEGARGHIADENGVIVQEFGPIKHKNPTRLRVEAGKTFRVHIELPGYEAVDQERTIRENETVVISPNLQKAKATLKVTTTPEGAQVSFKGKLLGETPLVRNDQDAAKGELVIAKAGFDPIKQRIELVAGKTVEITQTLKAGMKYGTIKLTFKGPGWGDVYLKGAKLGRAPGFIKAPVGKTSLHLVNTGKTPSIQWDITCVVSETEQKECQTQLP